MIYYLGKLFCSPLLECNTKLYWKNDDMTKSKRLGVPCDIYVHIYMWHCLDSILPNIWYKRHESNVNIKQVQYVSYMYTRTYTKKTARWISIRNAPTIQYCITYTCTTLFCAMLYFKGPEIHTCALMYDFVCVCVW